MELPDIDTVTTEDEARQLAIDWQHYTDQQLSWGELAYSGDYFEELGKKFNLTDEFKENAII